MHKLTPLSLSLALSLILFASPGHADDKEEGQIQDVNEYQTQGEVGDQSPDGMGIQNNESLPLDEEATESSAQQGAPSWGKWKSCNRDQDNCTTLGGKCTTWKKFPGSCRLSVVGWGYQPEPCTVLFCADDCSVNANGCTKRGDACRTSYDYDGICATEWIDQGMEGGQCEKLTCQLKGDIPPGGDED